MEWADRMRAAIDYIEDHLRGELSYEQAARAAGCPNYHFQRMFAFLAEVTLSEYIRRRRLTLAAFELQQSHQSVIDVALAYGYQSHAAFTRAFRELHGMSPTAARQPGARLKAYPRLSFQMTVQGRAEMSYRIERKPGFAASGFLHDVCMDQAYTQVPKLWQEASQDGRGAQLIDLLADRDPSAPHAVLGVLSGGDWGREDAFSYALAVPYGQEAPEGMAELQIPGHLWVIFEPARLADFTATWQRLYTEWLPTSDYVLADVPAIECYYPPGHDPQHELWIPIETKGR